MLSIRRRVAQLGALGLLGLALACQAPAPAPTTGGGGASQPSANPIKIGALFSTTGTLAPFGQGALPDTIKAQNIPDLQAESIKIIDFEQFQTTDTDLTPVLAKVRELGAKQVYVAASGVQAATAAKNFKQMNYPGSYWTFAGNANETFINLVGAAADIVNVAGTKVLVYKELPASDPSQARLAP